MCSLWLRSFGLPRGRLHPLTCFVPVFFLCFLSPSRLPPLVSASLLFAPRAQYYSEYMVLGSTFLFREGRAKGIGKIRRVVN